MKNAKLMKVLGNEKNIIFSFRISPVQLQELADGETIRVTIKGVQLDVTAVSE